MPSNLERLEGLDRLLDQPGRVLDVPGDEWDDSPESTWQKLDRLETAMGADALGAMLRRQGVARAAVEEALGVLARRRAGRSPAV